MMTSIVADVLAAHGEIEKSNLESQVAHIEKKIADLKTDVTNFMNDNYIDFSSHVTRNVNLVTECEKSIEELNELQKRIDQQVKTELSGSTNELKNLSVALKESNLSIEISHKLMKLHENLNNVDKFIMEEEYTQSVTCLLEIPLVLNDPENGLTDLHIVSAIEERYYLLHSSIVATAISELFAYVSWSGIENDSDEKSVSFTIKNNKDKLEDLCKALSNINSLSSYLTEFSNALFKFIIQPIIKFDYPVHITFEKTFTMFKKDEKSKSYYKSVFHNLTLLFKLLHKHLNVDINGESFMHKLKDYLLEKMEESLISDCISHVIPTSISEMRSFDSVVGDIKEFKIFLTSIGFIKENQSFLNKYAENVDLLITEKMCQDLLVKARNFMKKDLHEVKRYVPGKSRFFGDDDAELKFESKINTNSFYLSSCTISKSAEDIFELVERTLKDACHATEATAIGLHNTCRNIIEMYINMMPMHHEQLIYTIPQQAAIFHNNCMYLGHHLLTLSYDYRNKLRSLKIQNRFMFVDQTLLLRDIGSQLFLESMLQQKNFMTELLTKADFPKIINASELSVDGESSIRRCIRHLELLKTQWLDILPRNIYCRSIGRITDTLIDEILTRVISVEDIPAKVATELVAIFEVMLDRIPSIFPDPESVESHVKKWTQFQKLIMVLGATLKIIEDEWDNGKGPLAKAFTATQMKKLIRALFQNTDRRSALISIMK